MTCETLIIISIVNIRIDGMQINVDNNVDNIM